MNTSELVLVDTSSWLNLDHQKEETFRRLEPLHASGRLAVCGTVLQEVLQGARDESQFRRLARDLSAFNYLEEIAADYLTASRIYSELRWRGTTVPCSNCRIAAVALRLDIPIDAEDGHFSLIPNLRLCRPV